jgi:ATP-dependent protease ClpP protease subunit
MNQHDYNIDVKTRTVYFINTVTTEAAAEFVKNIRMLDRIKSRITVVLSTEGGDIEAGVIMYQAMKMARSPITVLALSQVESIGVLILQGAERRIVGPMTSLLDHEGTITIKHQGPEEASQTVESYRVQYNAISDEIYARIARSSKLTRRQYDLNVRNTVVLSGQDIVDAGYADEVVKW